MKYISGDQRVRDNLLMQRNRTLSTVGEAVEKTCIDVANHAKAGHGGNIAHMNQRYRNRTMNLTNSITSELLEINFSRVHGIIPAGMEYAAFVEFGTAINVRTGRPNRPYPYMVPALLANREVLQKRLSKILK